MIFLSYFLQDEYKVVHHDGQKLILCERLDIFNGIEQVRVSQVHISQIGSNNCLSIECNIVVTSGKLCAVFVAVYKLLLEIWHFFFNQGTISGL